MEKSLYRNDHSEWFKLSEEELSRFLVGLLPYPANEFLKDVTEDLKGEFLIIPGLKKNKPQKVGECCLWQY